MTRTLSIAICALLALAMLAPASAPAAKPKAKVTVLGWFPFGPPPAGFWLVRVKSDANKCQKKRNVELYKREGEDNVSLGSGNTAKEGSGEFWIWEFAAFEPADGDYFALAPPTNKCKRAESKIFTYPDDN